MFLLRSMLLLIPLVGGCVRETTSDLAQLKPRADSSRQEAQPVAATHGSQAEMSASRLLPPPEALSDPVISAKVKASLMADPAMTGSDVSVNTDRGVVSLTGVVASQEQAAVAAAHAQRQDGVMRVDDHLAVNLQ